MEKEPSSPFGERIEVRGAIPREHPHPSPLPPRRERETVSQIAYLDLIVEKVI